VNLFNVPELFSTGMQPRPYQSEAIEALDDHMRRKSTNPCVVVPTGGGKSILMAWAIQKWKAEYPPFRCCVLAHRKELVQQNADELRDLWPAGDIGVYAAGLSRKDTDHAVIFASIDSIFRKWGEFPPFDVLIIDESHRIPAKGEGKYRDFIAGCQKLSKHLRVVGFTATPYRMGCGSICHKDHILNEVCYEANVGDLIRDGYLCRLRSRIGDVQPDLANVKRNSGGDYITNSLADAMEGDEIVEKAIRSAMTAIIAENRKSVVWFCVDIKHCQQVSAELRKYGVDAPYVTAKTAQYERDRIAKAFIDGRYRHICNVNVYTEGFNAKRVDCIVLLRPTLSKGLYVQMVGRGLRLHPDKTDCIVLDYAHCIEEHGPIDCITDEEVKVEICAECGDAFSRAVRICPNCGWEIPKKEIERREAEERERQKHATEASKRNILGTEPELMEVDEVTVQRHRKPGKPDSIRVQYRSGLSVFREWICFDHGGYAEQKARKWWMDRFGIDEAKDMTVDRALTDMFLGARIADRTGAIMVVQRGKNTEITGYQLK
jgi:DNA repair protein RadD